MIDGDGLGYKGKILVVRNFRYIIKKNTGAV